MKTKMAMNVVATVLQVVVLLGAFAGQGHGQRCGSQGEGMECPKNECCSGNGFCGISASHCGSGCQSGACCEPILCGNKANGTVCPSNMCCSKDGKCGLGGGVCGDGCQTSAGMCNTLRCSSTTRCPNNQCCSYDDWCGFGPRFCGTGCKHGACCTSDTRLCGNRGCGRVCDNQQCCGADGTCGLGNAFCGAGCQSGSCNCPAALSASLSANILGGLDLLTAHAE